MAASTPDQQVRDVMAELAALEDPRIRAVNMRHGDDHGVNLSALRRVAKEAKHVDGLAGPLWDTGDSAARLVALLLWRPKQLSVSDVDAMLRQSRTPKVTDWLVNYIAKKHPDAERLRVLWFADPDPLVAAAGWALTSHRIGKRPDGLDLDGLLDVVESDMKTAPDRLQWAMNECLAQIGIISAEHRARALQIGERLEVLKDYPTAPGCVSPYAPIWINEMVKRRSA